MVIIFKCHHNIYTVVLGIPSQLELSHDTSGPTLLHSPVVILVQWILIDHKVLWFRLTVNVFTSSSLWHLQCRMNDSKVTGDCGGGSLERFCVMKPSRVYTAVTVCYDIWLASFTLSLCLFIRNDSKAPLSTFDESHFHSSENHNITV